MSVHEHDGLGPRGTDGTRDSAAVGDDAYLEELGYKQQLNRSLGIFSSFAVQFSALAIFSAGYTGMSIGLFSFGPAFFWAWVIGGAMQVFVVGLCVAELVSAYPLAGGAYQIVSRITSQAKSRIARSNFWAWQTGWWIIIAHAVSVPATAYLMIPYISTWIGLDDPSATTQMWMALAICALCTSLNLAGVKIAAKSNDIAVYAEVLAGVVILGAIIAVIVVGNIDTQPLSVFTDTAGTVEDGDWLKPFMFALLLPLYFIQSFDSTGNASEETKDAARTAPKGLFLANLSGFGLGTVFFAVFILAIPSVPGVMSSDSPARLIAETAVGSTVTEIFQVLAILALVGNCTVIQLTGVRVLWAQARDGQMIGSGFLSKVSTSKVPVNATLVTFGVSILVTVSAAQAAEVFTVLVGLTALAWAMAYGVVVVAGFWSLVTHRLPARPFNLGRASTAVFGLAIIWSVVELVAIVWVDPRQIGGGMAGAILVGTIIYALIPSDRRRADEKAVRRAG